MIFNFKKYQKILVPGWHHNIVRAAVSQTDLTGTAACTTPQCHNIMTLKSWYMVWWPNFRLTGCFTDKRKWFLDHVGFSAAVPKVTNGPNWLSAKLAGWCVVSEKTLVRWENIFRFLRFLPPQVQKGFWWYDMMWAGRLCRWAPSTGFANSFPSFLQRWNYYYINSSSSSYSPFSKVTSLKQHDHSSVAGARQPRHHMTAAVHSSGPVGLKAAVAAVSGGPQPQ